MAKTGVIYGINGPIVHIKGDVGFEMHEMVYVGKDNLVGEVIGLASDDTIIEVYEETTGMKPGEIVTGTGAPVSVTLAPGILNNIFDGIERPLSEIAKEGGAYIGRGVNVDSLDTQKLWETHMTVKAGIKIADKAFVPGKKVLVHLPIPAECASISNVEILDHTDFPCHIADKNSLSRTISFETVLEENRDFFVKYSYDCTAKYTALDYNAPSSIDSNETVEEMAPQIVFTPYIKKLCAELSEGIEDPLHKARAFYKYCTENVTYAFMREYMTLGNICEYAAAQRIGDCGVKALLFITLCRCAGIPAHWQSGLYVTPDFIGNHDWSMFKIEPYGWLYADPSFGGSAFRNKEFERQEFYFGNLDPFRMVANNELQQEFDPPKKQWRRDPYDNQSGEIEYEDRGLIHDEVETEMVILSAEKI